MKCLPPSCAEEEVADCSPALVCFLSQECRTHRGSCLPPPGPARQFAEEPQYVGRAVLVPLPFSHLAVNFTQPALLPQAKRTHGFKSHLGRPAACCGERQTQEPPVGWLDLPVFCSGSQDDGDRLEVGFRTIMSEELGD